MMDPMDRRTRSEPMTLAECWQALEDATVGRLAVVVDGFPVVYPVNHLTEYDALVIRSDPGGKRDALVDGAPVSFQVDALDRDGRHGWSVLVKGHARPMGNPDDLLRADPLGRRPTRWTDLDPRLWVRIEPAEITGRRVHRTGDDPTGRDQPHAEILEPSVGAEWTGDDDDTPLP
jgi:nitroimidazol reductase NimA-like FMN-containing flavoprotein (pyridoxamine 5'-phosphate oxidase superfamily)